MKVGFFYYYYYSAAVFFYLTYVVLNDLLSVFVLLHAPMSEKENVSVFVRFLFFGLKSMNMNNGLFIPCALSAHSLPLKKPAWEKYRNSLSFTCTHFMKHWLLLLLFSIFLVEIFFHISNVIFILIM